MLIKEIAATVADEKVRVNSQRPGKFVNLSDFSFDTSIFQLVQARRAYFPGNGTVPRFNESFRRNERMP